MGWLVFGIVISVLGLGGTIAYLVHFAHNYGLQGYDCNKEAYEKQKAIPWWKRTG